MPHIDINGIEEPGIGGLFQFRPETGRPLQELAEALLRGPSPLSRGERELIAAHVSWLNECEFCAGSHSAFAAAQLPGGAAAVAEALDGRGPTSAKLKALLALAGRVQLGGHAVREEDMAAARAAGAKDVEIHDAVLIAAAFCMFNRYVDGLGAVSLSDPTEYAKRAEEIVVDGYVRERRDDSQP
jgi:uncharacterized peroxidase-related enzyme